VTERPEWSRAFGVSADRAHEGRKRFAEVGEQRSSGEAQRAIVEHGVRRARRGPGRIEVGRRDRLDACRVEAAARSTSPANSNQLTAP